MSAADLTQSTINGQLAAEKFITDLSAKCPVGDDLHYLVNQLTQRLSAEHDAFMRGFCRRLQKELEKRA
jgi:hypothetical protein